MLTDSLAEEVGAAIHPSATVGSLGAHAHVDTNEAPATGLDLGSLYKNYWGDLCSYLRVKFGVGPPDPEDIAQATFARMATVPAVQNIINPRAFLCATARNLVLDYHRHQRYCDNYAYDVLHTAEHGLRYEISPERVVLDRERVQMLAEALAKLPARQRWMILLNRFEGLGYAEVGRRFGISTANAQKQVERALAECLRYMNAGGMKMKTKRRVHQQQCAYERESRPRPPSGGLGSQAI